MLVDRKVESKPEFQRKHEKVWHFHFVLIFKKQCDSSYHLSKRNRIYSLVPNPTIWTRWEQDELKNKLPMYLLEFLEAQLDIKVKSWHTQYAFNR